MLLLPRGTPVYEGVAAATLDPPLVLEKLRADRLTGYARFRFPTAVGILVYEEGRLLSAMIEANGRRLSALEGLSAIFERIGTEGGQLDVYRFSADLARGVQALLHGDVLYEGQEVRLIDAKGLLAKLRAEQLSGCLRIYTADRTALIFYREGTPLGFFHDGSDEIETSATEAQRVAGLPGAKIDVLSTADGARLASYDLVEMVNVRKVWEMTGARHAQEMARLAEEARRRSAREAEARIDAIEEKLREIAMAFLGKMGRAVVDKEIQARGGRAALIDRDEFGSFLAGVEKAARLLTGSSQTDQLVKMMRAAIADVWRT